METVNIMDDMTLWFQLHVLQDQYFDIGDRMTKLGKDKGPDTGEESVLDAIIEGDATRVESSYRDSLNARQRKALDAGRNNDFVFGDDPRQGFVQSGVFYQPQLAFQFQVPSGWQLANLASQVQMQPQAADAAIILTTASGTTPSAT